MNQTSKTLLSALIISLFSLATLQGYRVITQNPSESQVLGDTTVKSVPCDIINGWQKQYCSSVGYTTPTVAPTREPMGTPIPLPTTYCRGGYYGGTYGPSCGDKTYDLNNYYLKFACADNTPGTVGDISLKTCYNKNDLVNMADKFCSSHSVCSTPTRAPMGTPVVIKATPIPTRAPMGTPVVIKATPTLSSKPTPVIYNQLN